MDRLWEGRNDLGNREIVVIKGRICRLMFVEGVVDGNIW